MGSHPVHQLFYIRIILSLRDCNKLVAADAEYRAAFKNIADNFRSILQVPVPGLMSARIIDRLQAIYIKHYYSKWLLHVCRNQAVHMCFHFHVRMPVLNSRQSINIDLRLCLFKEPAIRLFLPDLGINIIEAHNKPQSFLLFHHGGFQLIMDRFSFRHDAVPQRKDSAPLHLRHNVLFCKTGEHALLIVRMTEYPCRFSQRGKEVRTGFCLGEILFIIVCTAEFTIAAGLRIDNIKNDIVRGERGDPV